MPRTIDFIHKYKTMYPQSVEYVLVAYLGVPEHYNQWRVIFNLPEFLSLFSMEEMHDLGLVCRAFDFLVKNAGLYGAIRDLKTAGMGPSSNYHLEAWRKAQPCYLIPYLPIIHEGVSSGPMNAPPMPGASFRCDFMAYNRRSNGRLGIMGPNEYYRLEPFQACPMMEALECLTNLGIDFSLGINYHVHASQPVSIHHAICVRYVCTGVLITSQKKESVLN